MFISDMNSIFNIKSIEFSIYYIFFGFWTCFFQILQKASNTRHDVTIAFYFHTVKKKLLIFSKCEHNNLWRYLYHSTDKIWKCNKMVFWLKLKTLPLKEMIFKNLNIKYILFPPSLLPSNFQTVKPFLDPKKEKGKDYPST